MKIKEELLGRGFVVEIESEKQLMSIINYMRDNTNAVIDYNFNQMNKRVFTDTKHTYLSFIQEVIGGELHCSIFYSIDLVRLALSYSDIWAKEGVNVPRKSVYRYNLEDFEEGKVYESKDGILMKRNTYGDYFIKVDGDWKTYNLYAKDLDRLFKVFNLKNYKSIEMGDAVMFLFKCTVEDIYFSHNKESKPRVCFIESNNIRLQGEDKPLTVGEMYKGNFYIRI